MGQALELGDPMVEARVWTEVGDLHRAEACVAGLLESRPEDLDAISMLAKIKHMRGELTAAVACWAHLHARSPYSESTHLHLVSMLHLAQDPEKGAGEFLALGQGQLMRKPAAYLALEEAFHLFVARRPRHARAHCRMVASAHDSRDMHKLATLAEAWIAELSGQFEDACIILETLGSEHGFEHDLDRVTALARVYEALGTPEHLASAVNIYRFLEQTFEPLPVLGKLAVLYRALGQQELASEYGERHLQAFRAGMQRPTRHEVLQVASRHYVPLGRLLALFADFEPEPRASGRQEALALALQGEYRAALAQFAESDESLDKKYCADLAVMADDGVQAQRLYCEVLVRDPGDLQALSWLLERLQSSGDQRIANLITNAAVAKASLAAITEELAVRPSDSNMWRTLAFYYGLFSGHTSEQTQAQRRARTLREAEERGVQSIGCALAAAVYRFVGKAKGLIHQVWVTREKAQDTGGGQLPQDRILGNLTPEMRQQVLSTFLAVRQYARAKFPYFTEDLFDYDYTFKVTKEDEPSGGCSADLPMALAFLSVFLQRPLAQDTASTGVIVADAHDVLLVRRVGDIEHKLKGAYHRNLRRLIVPADNRADLEDSSFVPRPIAREVASYAATLEQAVHLAFDGDPLDVRATVPEIRTHP